MILDRIIRKLPIQSRQAKVYIGAFLAALVICFGTLLVLALLHTEINFALPAAFGAIGAAAYAVKANQR